MLLNGINPTDHFWWARTRWLQNRSRWLRNQICTPENGAWETKTVEPSKTPESENIEVAIGVPAGPGRPSHGCSSFPKCLVDWLFSCSTEFCSSDLEGYKFCFTFCSLSKLSFLLLLAWITSSNILRSFLEDWCVLSTTISANWTALLGFVVAESICFW